MKFLIIFSVVFILPFHLQSQILTDSFQDGVDGYDGTIDTYIDKSIPGSPFGSSTGILWDKLPDEYTTLISFDNIFVSEGGPIPDNSFIISATLTYYVYNPGDDAAVSEILIPWDNSLTWNQLRMDCRV